jgi:hypothetical protein
MTSGAKARVFTVSNGTAEAVPFLKFFCVEPFRS